MTGGEQRVVVITGPTGSGKSALAIALADRFDGEIVNADSMQVYRYMDIGTAKATPEERERVVHHLIDRVAPDEEYSVADYRVDGAAAIDDIVSRGKTALLVGGSGLYIRGLTRGLFDGPPADPAMRSRFEELENKMGQGYLHGLLVEADPSLARKIHPHNRVRIIRALEVSALTGQPLSRHQERHGFGEAPYRLLMIGIAKERERLYSDINDRVERMFAAGLEAEVEGLLDRGYGPSLKPMGALGYRETVALLRGEWSREEAIGEIKKNTRHYAKRQLTWFRREDSMVWFAAEEGERISRKVEEFLR